jgi:hypothetical protein
MTIKTIFLDDPPIGSNKLSSRSGFVQRISYESYFDKFLKNYGLQESDFFDGRIKNINYGRVDYYGNTIHVSEAFLKNLNGSEEYMALNFVCDAFENFKYLMESSASTNGLITDKFRNIKVKNGFKNLHKKYHEHMDNIYKSYVRYSTLGKKDKKIIDFSSFLNNFISFLNVISDKTPFIKSSFIRSKELSVLDTALVVEIEEIPKDKDEDKFKKYFDNPDFLVYQQIANRTGFKIDRDCPWRLVFDVNSPEAKQYMSEYQITSDDVFEDYYYKTHEYDLENLKLYLIMFYNSYCALEPNIATSKIIVNNNIQTTTSQIISRKQIDLDYVNKNIRFDYWFKLMCYIKLLENKVSLTQNQYENEIENLINSYNKHGLLSGFGALNKLINTSKKSDKKTFIFT